MHNYYNASDVRFLSDDEINAVSGGVGGYELLFTGLLGTLLVGMFSAAFEWLFEG